MTAAEVKTALRRRHPAWSQGMVGEWTCIEEWQEIDLLAISAWSRGRVVGYEVKVSRSDYRRELLNPDKRAAAVAGCHEFYFAVPDGLLSADELAFVDPGFEREAFQRERCPGVPEAGVVPEHRRVRFDGRDASRKYGGPCFDRRSGRQRFRVSVPAPVVYRELADYEERDPERALRYRAAVDGQTEVPCPRCGGRGYVDVSRVEREAPTLWVPADVGLIVVTSRGCRVVRKAPKRTPETPIVARDVAKLVRWVSVRPDPRHAEVTAEVQDVA